MYNLIDPHCVIFPRNHAEQTLFLPEDLESFLSNEVPTVNDLPTQLYLDTLSKIAGTKLTKPLPINGFFLTGEQASDFTKDFFKSFENGLLTGPTEKKKRNEIETEVVKKLYRDVNAKIKNFLLNSNLIDQVSDDHFDYSKKIELTCKLAIRGLEITDITENSTEEQKQEQLDLTELRLKMLIDDTRSGDLFKCMVWDCMKMIYPRFTHLFEARLSNFKRPKECPEITDSPNLFEQFKVEIVSDTIMPSVASQKTPLSQLVSTPKAIN